MKKRFDEIMETELGTCSSVISSKQLRPSDTPTLSVADRKSQSEKIGEI